MQHPSSPVPGRSSASFAPAALLLAVFAALVYAPALRAEDAAQFLARAAQAARQLNYVGTIVFQSGGRVETSRLIHLNDGGPEFEKLVNLDGPAREVIRSQGEVRCYYPDAKIVRVEPRTFRNVFPSLSAEQQQSLSKFYEFKRAETARVAGLEAQAYVFEPRDQYRYGHKFWADVATGLLLKARIVNDRGEVIEQFAFTDLSLNARIDRDMVKPSWAATPADWSVQQGSVGDGAAQDTGWTVSRLPPGFVKINEGFRKLRGKPGPVAHLVFSDGLVAVSVFVESMAGSIAPQAALQQQGGLNVFTQKLDDYLVTVLGEAPGATVRQIGNAVARR